jgi:hypothetical protein
MKRYLLATLLLVGLTAPALAAEHYAVEDTVNYCTVIDAAPSRASDLRMIGNPKGYQTKAEAEQALNSNANCKA